MLACAFASADVAGAQSGPDPAVAAALALLGADAPTVQIVVMKPYRGTTAGVGPIGEWEARTDGTTITVAKDGDAYRRARKGDAIRLAAVIAHEAFHITHRGAGEAPAYAEQLRVLRALGAAPGEIRALERIAAAIVR